MSASPLVAAGAGLLGIPLLAVMVFFGSGAPDAPASGTMVCTVAVAPTGAAGASSPVITLSGPQTDQARTIVAAAKALGMDAHAAAIAIMVARQESDLANLANSSVPASLALPHEGVGHNADSVGVFQQRPSMGWGTVPQLMDPAYAATAFLRALGAVAGWQTLPAWQAGQAVQNSGDGTLYEQWQPLGDAVAAALFAGTTGALTCTDTGGPLPAPNTAAAATAIAYARRQLGKPYVYGGTGPAGFDCSGLVYEAYAAAGITLPRTAEYQIDAGPAVPADQLQPGDLVFFNLGEQIPGRPGHVGIYLGDGLMIDAPHTGAFVRIESVDGFGSYVGATRVVPAPATTTP